MATTTRIVIQQAVNLDTNNITAGKYPRFVVSLGFSVTGVTINDLTNAIQETANNAAVAATSAAAAKASQDAAKVSETNAKASETAAKVSENNAKTSETNAKASETAAKVSENNAKTSETNAKASETAAKVSENNAKTSETNAKTSETNAKTSETNAKTSETNALASKNAAAASQTAAAASQTAAKTSETNAKTSETNANTSETNAKNSETAAKTAQTAAELAKTNAETAERNATESAHLAKISETNAANSASATAISATNAFDSATQSATSATNSKNSADAAAASATAAANSATKAAAQAASDATNIINEQLQNQNSIFISQFNQQAQKFDAQLTSQESRYEIVLQQAGKTVLGRYEDGPWTLTSYNQLVSYGGTFWKLAASVVIGSGYTTAGKTDATWNATDRANFVDVGQDQLRTELGTIFMPAASGNAATDVQLLQAALNVGGKISYNLPGEYLYGTHSVIKSGTSFHTAAGVNWKQVAGKVNPFLVNEAFSASRYAVTSMTKNTSARNGYLDGYDIGSHNYITIVCPNHPFIRGDWAAFHGANEFGYDGIMRVISVVDANTFIAESHSRMTSNSATANTDFWNGMWCFKADTNIEVDIQGRIDGNWRGNSTASATDFDERVKFMGMSFWGVNNLTVRLNDAFNIRKYAVLLANVRNVHVPRINFYNFSDGLHIQPPFVGISVGTLAGATGDDLLALTNGDYVTYQLSRGHGYSIYVDHLMPQNALTALKAAGAPGYKFWDIDIGSISGSVRLQIISAIRDGILSYTDIGRLRIRSCACMSQTKDDFYLNTDKMGSFIIDDYEVCSLDSGTWCITMGNRYGITGNIKHIGIKNIRYKDGVPLKSIAYIGNNCSVGLMDLHFANATPLNGAQAVVHTEQARTQSGDAGESAGGFIDTLKISGKFTFPNAGIGRLFWARALWNRVLLDNFVMENGERVIHENLVTGNKGKVFCNNVHVKGASGFCNTYNGVEAYHASTLLETSNQPYWLRDASSVLNIYGAVQTLNSKDVCRVDAGKYYAKGLDVPVDLTDYPPAGNHGDIVFNTNPVGNPVGRYQFNRANGTWELQNRENISQQPSDVSATIYNPIWGRGFNWVQTLTQNVQFTASVANLTTLNRGDKIRLYLTQDATGGRIVTFDTWFKFPVAWVNGGTAGQHTIGEFVYDGQFLVLERANVWY